VGKTHVAITIQVDPKLVFDSRSNVVDVCVCLAKVKVKISRKGQDSRLMIRLYGKPESPAGLSVSLILSKLNLLSTAVLCFA
jgi:hypothetical protein